MACRWISVLLILFLAAGCGSQSVITDPKEVQTLNGHEESVIEFWHTYSDEETRLLEQELIPAFERENPNIRVNPLRLDNNYELKNTLIARASSNRAPDAVRMDITWIPELAQKGLLEPLNSFPGFEEIRSTVDPGAMSLGYYQNRYCSLPLDISTKAAIFNRELLNRAGYSEPPQTLEEVLELARQHRFIIGIGGWDGWNTLPYLYGLGGVLTDRTFSKASGFLNGEGTIRAVEQLAALYKEKLIDLSAGGGDNWKGVRNGNVLMTNEGPWFYSLLDKPELDKALKLTIPAPFPHAYGPSSIISGEHLVIMKGSKRPNEAWLFMKWMAGKEAQLVMSRTGLIPANMEAAKALTVNRDSFIYPYVKALDHGFLRPPVKNWGKIDEVYSRYLRKILTGELSVKDGLDRAAAEIDLLLADAGPAGK